jgi:ribosomal protein S18 acetylase RimI-like enzyme
MYHIKAFRKLFVAHTCNLLRRSLGSLETVQVSGFFHAVHAGYRRQGYASALLDAAVEKLRFRRVGSVALHVDPSRTAAAELYKKLGFVVESYHESYYAPGRHAIRMVLELGS